MDYDSLAHVTSMMWLVLTYFMIIFAPFVSAHLGPCDRQAEATYRLKEKNLKRQFDAKLEALTGEPAVDCGTMGLGKYLELFRSLLLRNSVVIYSESCILG